MLRVADFSNVANVSIELVHFFENIFVENIFHEHRALAGLVIRGRNKLASRL